MNPATSAKLKKMEREKKDRMGFPHIRSHAKIKMDRGDIENKKKNQLSGAAKRKKKKERERAIAEAAADLERLRIGPTKLWTGLVLHHRDIFETHVIPKLNRTDRFFLSKVNRASSDVLAYANVDVSQLKWDILECTSVSMLEWVWNNMPWGELSPMGEERRDGRVMDQAWFCGKVAETKKLEFLNWAREVKNCAWDEETLNEAAYSGQLDMLMYCYFNGCPCNEQWSCNLAATAGHLDCLRFLVDELQPSQDMIASAAAQVRHLDTLKYFVEEREISREVTSVCLMNASGYGRLDCLKYLLEAMRAPLVDWRYIAFARCYEHFECLHLLQEKGFPEPTDKEYAHFIETHTGGAFRQ
jgi:hypothetical protein